MYDSKIKRKWFVNWLANWRDNDPPLDHDGIKRINIVDFLLS